MDLRQQGASPYRSHKSYKASPQSYGFPTISPLNARYTSPYRPSLSNASPGLIRSSSNLPFHRLCCQTLEKFTEPNIRVFLYDTYVCVLTIYSLLVEMNNLSV
ncbi:hypothetical protein Bca4012_027714 [Brassica carinata]